MSRMFDPRYWVGASFAAMALMVVSSVGCGGGSEPVSSSKSKYKVAQNDASGGESSATTGEPSGQTPTTASGGASSGRYGSDPRPNGGNRDVAPQPRSRGGVSEGSNRGSMAGQPVTGSRNSGGNGARGSLAPPPKPPTLPREDLDAIQVPEGPPEALVQFLNSLQRRPRGATEEEQRQDVINTSHARIKAADRLLASAKQDEHFELAAQQKISGLVLLAQTKQPGYQQKAEAYAEELAQHDKPQLANMGRLVTFNMKLGEWAQSKDRNPQEAIALMDPLLDPANMDIQVFQVLLQTPEVFKQLQHEAAAQQASQLIFDAARKSRDPDVVAQQGFIDEKFVEKAQAYFNGNAAALPEMMQSVRNLLARPTDSVFPYQQLGRLPEGLEKTRQYAAAGEVYELLQQAYHSHPEKRVVQEIEQTTSKGLKRTGLVGKPLPVQGTLVSGMSFDWAKYKGKIVLVDFWATWCQPCIREFPHLRETYEKYRDRGFDVVGVNIDGDRQAMLKFLQEQNFPWANVVTKDDPAQQNWDNPNIAACGISAIPFTVLLDRQGKVIDYDIRGEELSQRLSELLPAGAGKTGQHMPPPGLNSAAGAEFHFVSFANAQEDKEAEYTEKDAQDDVQPDVNPYSPPADLTPAQLVEFIFNMEEKPKSIQQRQGFAEAILQAADQLLNRDDTKRYRTMAVITKLRVLHKQASADDKQADEALAKLTEEYKEETNKKIARWITFLQLEREVLDAQQLPIEKVPKFLAQLRKKLQDTNLTDRHLRLASTTIKVVNRLEDGDAREKQFAQFGPLFAKSTDLTLQRYGKQLVKKPEGDDSDPVSELVGKPLELDGVTALGDEFDWKSYRGKVVLVDFWATWCGPCVRAMPRVKAFYEEYKDKGLQVVGVSLDRDEDKLNAFIEENEIPWTNLAGEHTQDLARKYSVRAIPTMMLVDQNGKIVAVGHNLDKLKKQAEELFKKPSEEKPSEKSENEPEEPPSPEK